MALLSQFSLSFLPRLTAELTLLATSELLVRRVWPRQAHAGRKRPAKLLLFQLCFLLACSLLLSGVLLLGHVTYVLLLACCYLVARVAALSCQQPVQDGSQHLSAPLQLPVELEDSDTELSPGEFGNSLTPPTFLRPSHQEVYQPTPRDHVPYQRHPLPYNGASLTGARSSRDGSPEPDIWRPASKPRISTHAVPHSARPGANAARQWSQPSHLAPLHSSFQRRPVLTVSSSSPQRLPASNSSSPHPPLFSSSFSPPPRPPDPPPRPPASTAPPGLLNYGNRCFVNSVVHCLTWTAGLPERIFSASAAETEQTSLTNSLAAAFTKCRVLPDGVSLLDPIDPSDILTALSEVSPHLVVHPAGPAHQPQQDAAELLLCLLNHLHTALKQDTTPAPTPGADTEGRRERAISELDKAKSEDIQSLREPLRALAETGWEVHAECSSSVIHELFLGQLVEARECQHCKQLSFSAEYFTVLHLPVPLPSFAARFELDHCLKMFGEVEALEAGNMLSCSSCWERQGGGAATFAPGKRLALLTRPPKVLVCQLMRYSYDSYFKAAFKNTVTISVPPSLNLHPFTMEAKLYPEVEKEVWYQLYAVCVHSGAQTTSHGHYVCYCQATDGRWFYYNDQTVSPVPMEAELSSSFVSQNAYLLFYALQQ